MRTRIIILLAVATLSGIGTAPARAQTPTVDSRWLAFVGCWRSIEIGRETTVCLVPGAEAAAIDLVTIDSGRVVAAEQIDVTGARVETARGDCSGWQSARWSEVSDRIYLDSEETCPGWGARTGTGLIALTDEGQLLYIQGNTIVTKTGIRVQRYREAREVDLPSEVKDALRGWNAEVTATARARAAAAAPLAIEDLVEASRALDLGVVEAWLIARGGSFNLDANRLVALAKAGVPSRITDLMIALSNPGVFVVDASVRREARRASEDIGVTHTVPHDYGACAMGSGLLGIYGMFPFSSSYCDPLAFSYPYAFGWYPATILYTAGGSSSGGSGGSGGSGYSHGRIVNGRGYKEGLAPNAGVGRTGNERPTSSQGGSGGSTPSASASSGEQRTAKPRP